ncbi:MAG: class I SAM-dependent methyltransferase [Armatimonadetes bacterium]|nr:class I SAM-dependent methyltransferase [Armatimonadota bacterium]
MSRSDDDGRLYREYPWLYDAVARPRPGEFAHYHRLALAAGGAVLEPACGSGRLLAPLREAGLEVWGCDGEPAMVAAAAARLAGGQGSPHHLAVQALAELHLPVRAGLVMLPLDALRLCPDDAALLALLARCRKHLRPGGTLAGDLYLPASRDDMSGHCGPFAHPDGGTTRLTANWQVQGEWDVEVSHIVTLTSDGRQVDARSTERYRRIPLTRLLDALAQAGFGPPRLWAGFGGRAWHEGDTWVAFAAQRV